MAYRFWSAVVALMFTAACASAPTYVPATSDTAQVRLSIVKGNTPADPSGDTMTASVYEGEACESRTIIDLVYTADLPRNPRSGALDMPLPRYAQGSMHEFEIDAGTDHSMVFTFMNLVGGPFGIIYRCSIAMDQTFESGGQYELHGVFVEHGQCKVTLNELVADAAGPRREAIAEYTNATHLAPSACVSN